MEQYINKDALVAEIERRRSKNARNKLNLAASFEDNYLLSFIDTLETKEVDLEKEIKRFTMSKELYEADSVIKAVAKHFYELGLKAQRKISYVPNIDDSLKELGVDPDSKEAKIFKESYYTALEKLKAQKGK